MIFQPIFRPVFQPVLQPVTQVRGSSEPPSEDDWILADGTWNDSGVWVNSAVWNDGD